MKVNVSNLKEGIGKLKSQIVESPDELKSQLEKMRENIRATKMSIVSLEKQLKERPVLQCPTNSSFGLFFLQEETDGSMVEVQYLVQSVAHAEAEKQQLVNLLQDLESGFNSSKQRQEEVCSSTQ